MFVSRDKPCQESPKQTAFHKSDMYQRYILLVRDLDQRGILPEDSALETLYSSRLSTLEIPDRIFG